MARQALFLSIHDARADAGTISAAHHVGFCQLVQDGRVARQAFLRLFQRRSCAFKVVHVGTCTPQMVPAPQVPRRNNL